MIYHSLNHNQDLPCNKNINKIYEHLLGIEFNNTWLRWPKIGMVIDDGSGSSLFTNVVENKFFMFL